MPPAKTIRVTVEPSTLARMAELNHCLSGLHKVFPSSVEFREFVGGLLQRSSALDLRFLVTGRASDQWITLDASEIERDLMSAVRTLDWDRE
jgi:hypothetical protein